MGDPTILTQLARILENQERHMAQTTALEGRMAALEATVTREREAHAATVEVLNNRIAVLERTMEQGKRKQGSSNLVLHGLPERPGLVDLDEDLTPLQQQTRTALRDDYHRLKAEGKKPYWRGERLLFRDGERVEEHLPRRPPTHPAPQSGGAR